MINNIQETFSLSTTTPHEEKCASVGDDNYSLNARLEARAYINQLVRAYGEPPEGSRFKITNNPHDFGCYKDIDYIYSDENEAHIDYLCKIEEGCQQWDQEAIKELCEGKYELLVKVINIERAA
jgi:hypothetical protein